MLAGPHSTSSTPHPALGIDHGEARIGIAATDDFGILAHPVETIACAASDPVERIATLVQIRGVRTLVVGLPLRTDGSEAETEARVEAALAEALVAVMTPFPIRPDGARGGPGR